MPIAPFWRTYEAQLSWNRAELCLSDEPAHMSYLSRLALAICHFHEDDAQLSSNRAEP
jgi:hypothetical protein